MNDTIDVGDHAETERSKDGAGGEIAQNGAQSETAGNGNGDNGSHQEHDCLGKNAHRAGVRKIQSSRRNPAL